MNKFTKVIVAILGGVDVVFNIFVPVFIAILISNVLILSSFGEGLVWIIAFLSTLYRAIKFLVFED